MSSVLRSVATFTLVCAFAALAVPGCSQQGEGERCDKAENGDADCDSGLTCVKRLELLEAVTDRCCPDDGRESDKRCTRGVLGGGGGTSSSEAGAGGDAPSSAGSAAGGETTSGGTPGTSTDGGTPGTSTDGGTPSTSSDGGTPGTSTDGGTPSSQGGLGQGGA